MKKSIFRRIVNIIGYILITAIVIIIVFVMISSAMGNVAFIGRMSIVWVKTGSMEDLIPAQSYVLVEKIDPKDVEVGKVIIFK